MALVTGNVSVRKALEQIAEPSRILNTIKLAHASLAEEGHAAPRLVVAALNPQMGDNVFGEEETRLIGPAVAAARALGMAVTGPVAADTAYRRAARGEFDAVVCAEAGCGAIIRARWRCSRNQRGPRAGHTARSWLACRSGCRLCTPSSRRRQATVACVSHWHGRLTCADAAGKGSIGVEHVKAAAAVAVQLLADRRSTRKAAAEHETET